MKNDMVYIVGHKNPDTDSICAAIAYAELKRKLGIDADPRRLGEINMETAFVLNYFDTKAPELLTTIKTQVSDLNIDIVNPVSQEISVKTAWNIMKKNNVKSLPVVDENERLQGVVTLSDITAKYMDALDNNTIASSNTSLENIVETLNAVLLYGNKSDFKTTGKIVVTAMNPEEMGAYIEKGDIAITGNRIDSQLKALELGANVIILTNGREIAPEVLEVAKNSNCIVLLTPSDTFTTARLINQSLPIGYIMSTTNIVKFNIDDFVDDIKDKMLQTRYRSYPVVDDNDRVKGLISRYHLISKRKKKIILLDHNERTQTVNGIEEAELLEIIDHHRLGDIQTANPIYFKNEPVGSTSTIIANLFFDSGIRPGKNIAGIMCAAILSDTIKFRSPTCTYTDRITAEKLAEIAGIDMEQFALEMFKAGSTLLGKTPREILHQDFKEYKFGKHKIGIGQVNTMDMQSLEKIKDELLDYMNIVCHDQSLNLLILLVTDILNEGSELLYVGDHKELISGAFNVELGENSIYLKGIVSRKKQVVPNISAAVEKF